MKITVLLALGLAGCHAQRFGSDDSCDLTYEYDPKNPSKNSGEITSPKFPGRYPDNIKCTWTFKGSGNQRVQIIFQEFNLLYPGTTPYRSIGSEDALKCDAQSDILGAYVQTAQNSYWSTIETFCGTRFPPQLMSAGHSLRLELETRTQLANNEPAKNVGFRAKWRFVSNFGITSGVQTKEDQCYFEYRSSDGATGEVMSPNYPGFYPRNMECTYTFIGKHNEIVIINFEFFRLEGVKMCRNGSMSDYIEFSNYRYPDRNIPRFCGISVPGVMRSEGAFYQMTFHSNAKLDALGFHALYQFLVKREEKAIHKVKQGHAQRIASELKLLVALTAVTLFISNQ